MAFDYTGSGSIVFGNSSFYVSSYYGYNCSGKMHTSNCGNNITFLEKMFVLIPFKAGQRAWLKYKAQKGKIESIMVKSVKILSNINTLGGTNIIYFDNLNAVFNEEDLINQSTAINIALNYYQTKILRAQQSLECA